MGVADQRPSTQERGGLACAVVRVAVVGGGIAGVSIAYELAEEADVVLVEREPQLALHTTGRSAAMYLQCYGNDVVRALTRASALDFERLTDELDMPPILTPRALLWVADEAAATSLPSLHVAGAEPLDTESARALCPPLRAEWLAGAAIDRSGMEIDVMALHQGYVRGLRARG